MRMLASLKQEQQDLVGPVALVILIMGVGTGIWLARWGCISQGVYVASLLSPLPLGVWLSLKWPGNHTAAYFFIGAFTGIAGMAAFLLVILAMEGRISTTAASWVLAIIQYPLLSTVLVGGGGMYGDTFKATADKEDLTRLIVRFGGLPVAVGALISFMCGLQSP